MTYLELIERLAVRRNANPDSLPIVQRRRFGHALNESLREILRKPQFRSLRHGTVTFASVANQKLYALPTAGVADINRITEATNDRKLVYKTPAWLDSVAPDPQTGTPWAWVPRGYTEVHTQPSDASAVFVDSTSASDTHTAYVEGIRTGGYYGTATVTMTGTTAVQVGSITDFVQVTKFSLSHAAVGTVTLHEDASGGTELSRIAAGGTRAQFRMFQLFETPSAVITYTADIVRAITDLVADGDEPPLPEDFHALLLDMAEQKESKKSDDPQRYAMLAGSIKQGLAELTTWITAHPDWTPDNGEPVGISRLGAWYPADTWL